MTVVPASSLCVAVDVTNPGQFFACCGLLELTSRLGSTAIGWFEPGVFHIAAGVSLPDVITLLRHASLTRLVPEDATASPLQLGAPFNLRLDWWKSSDRSITDLKVWAGTMDSYRIARAMQHALNAKEFLEGHLFDVGVVAYDPEDELKKVEPFYFDARRGPNAHSRDVGFAPNDLALTTTASPAVELLCFIGLQRCRPVPTGRPRVFDYNIWTAPLQPLLLPAAIAGILPVSGVRGYCFESWFRTSQRKHKAFLSAQPKSPQSNHE